MMLIPTCLTARARVSEAVKPKASVNESVRGTDIYAMVDVTNYSLTYNMSGFTNHMSPDDHYPGFKAYHRRIHCYRTPCQCCHAFLI